jgi:hypothetical protein
MGPAVIELPFVVSLTIHPLVTITFPSVFSFLDFPAVETLTIHGHICELIELFVRHHRPYPAVRSLNIVTTYFSPSEGPPTATVLAFISLFPNVQDIAFHGTDPTPLFHALHNNQSTDELLWPQLATITLTLTLHVKASWKKQTWGHIAKVVGKRLQLGQPISHIRLPSQILERGTPRQQQRLRQQVGLTVLKERTLR